MSWFKTKQEINSQTMTSMVYQSVRVRTGEMEPLLDRAGVVYDPLENQLVIMGINYEILHWELKKGNPKDVVEKVIEGAYQRFYSSLNIDQTRILEYQQIMNNAKKKADDILFVHFGQKVPKNVLIFKLLLELEDINESIIDPSSRKEMELLIDGWFQVAKAINDEYKIVDTKDDLERNKPIDFDF